MRRTAVVLAALAVLAGCGTDTTGTSAQGGSTSATPATSSNEARPSDQPSDKPAKQPSKADDKPSGSTATPTTPPDAPACSAVWVDGTTLARDYEGCLAGRRFVRPDEEFCSFGKRLVRFSDHFYAVRGGPVNRTAAPLAEDRVYRGALASCSG